MPYQGGFWNSHQHIHTIIEALSPRSMISDVHVF